MDEGDVFVLLLTNYIYFNAHNGLLIVGKKNHQNQIWNKI